jgi:DNA-binding NarL/FixJ family response regulator
VTRDVQAEEPTVRVVVADDHPVYRGGLELLLSTVEGIDVVSNAANGVEAIARCAELMPDVVVMDLNMPEMDGVAATRAIRAAQPSVAVLVLTMHDDDESVFSAVQAGARGYLLKGADQVEIERAIWAVAQGGVIFGPALAERITAYFAGLQQHSTGAAESFPELTPRELDVLQLVAQGRNNHAIAAELVLSEKTVRNHVSNIFMKLQVADRAQAIVRARDVGMGGR